MKVAASMWVLPLQLGPELGLPSPSQLPVSALRLYTRTVDNKNAITPPDPPPHTHYFRLSSYGGHSQGRDQHFYRAQLRFCSQCTTES